jgi:SAM-dependent methyltransferase
MRRDPLAPTLILENNRFLRILRNLKMDLQYGGRFLGGVKKTMYADRGACDTANTDYAAMPYLFDGTVLPNDVVADIGSGKGRVLNYLIHNYPSHKIYGLELDPECAAGLSRRLRKHKNVEILSGNACQNIPKDANVFYMFNPFSADVMREFKASIEQNVRDLRSLKIIYYNPVCENVFSDDPEYVAQAIELPANFHRAVLIRRA